MTEALAAARFGDERAFRELTEPFRRELELHCYRMLGSLHDAEDVLQETLVAAWRGLADFEERSSVRTWLYRIATNRCLNVIRGARRHPVAPLPFDAPEPTAHDDIHWLEPCPDVLLANDPERRYTDRESVELAFIVALQRLPPRQTATLLLREVLGFSGAETAAMLGTSTTAVKAALQRAREALGTAAPVGCAPTVVRSGEGLAAARPDSPVGAESSSPAMGSESEREVSRRFADAFARRDVAGVIALLTDEAWLTMPPWPNAYRGRAAIGAFLHRVPAFDHGFPVRLIPVRANTQPAFACYSLRTGEIEYRATGMLVLTLAGDRIAAFTHFPPENLFARFSLPTVLR